MQFVKPMPFAEAVNKLGAKSLIGSQLKSSEWGDVQPALRERGFFSSQVENVRFLQRGRDGIADFLQANRETLPDGSIALKTGSRADFVDQMQEFLAKEGVERGTGGLTDITSSRRLSLIFDTQVRQANDYGYWKQGMDPDVLDEFPAQRFIRVQDVKQERDSHQQFEDQVYLKTDPIWARVINEDFGVPWGPWAWGCGHDVEDVDRDEAEALGLIRPGQRMNPDERNFNQNLKASTRGLDPDLLEKLKGAFGDQLQIEGETMRLKQRPVPPAPPEPAPHSANLVMELQSQERELAKRAATEKLIVLDTQGNRLLERDGGGSSVAIYGQDAPLLKDAVVTHNHPRGRSFSLEDVRTAVDFDFAELRVVGVKQPYTYALKRPARGWPARLARRYDELHADAVHEFALRVKVGAMTDAESDQRIDHEVMQRLAREFQLDYERTRRSQTQT